MRDKSHPGRCNLSKHALELSPKADARTEGAETVTMEKRDKDKSQTLGSFRDNHSIFFAADQLSGDGQDDQEQLRSSCDLLQLNIKSTEGCLVSGNADSFQQTSCHCILADALKRKQWSKRISARALGLLAWECTFWNCAVPELRFLERHEDNGDFLEQKQWSMVMAMWKT